MHNGPLEEEMYPTSPTKQFLYALGVALKAYWRPC